MDNSISKVLKKTSKAHLKGVKEPLCVYKIRKEANKHSTVEGAGSDLRNRKKIQKAVKAVGDPSCKGNGILIFAV